MKRRGFLALVPATLLIAACEPLPQVSEGDVLVTARLPAEVRRSLPADARLLLEVADVSLADAPAIRIAQAVLGPKDGLALVVPRPRFQTGRAYALSLRIEDAAGKLIWISDTRNSLPPDLPARIRFGVLSVVPVPTPG
jgi:putative lipoprotein